MSEGGERGMGEAKRMRRLTSAERHVNRALGRPDVEEIEIETTPTWEQHQERVLTERRSAKAPGMQTADYYGQRAAARNKAEQRAQAAAWGTAGDDGQETEEETEETEETAAAPEGVRTSGGWAFRPGGGMYLRTDGGTIVG
ncbi:hypothetical protein ACFRDV_16590 [Streptomyces fagopyri]|uniref:hypothetical protein n=1 Tax=Streptomyces fagopyri TaxID=2662397 RepID=UPI0036B3EF91